MTVLVTHDVMEDRWVFSADISTTTELAVAPLNLLYDPTFGYAITGNCTVLTQVQTISDPAFSAGVAVMSSRNIVNGRRSFAGTVVVGSDVRVIHGSVVDDTVGGITFFSYVVDDTTVGVIAPGQPLWVKVSSTDGVTFTHSYSYDGDTWVDVHTAATTGWPLNLGCGVLFKADAGVVTQVSAVLATLRVMDGNVLSPPANMDIGVVPVTQTMNGPALTVEPRVHAIVGAQLGDLEYDIGKCVPWVSLFCSDVFITDINQGTQRYWVVDWAKSFPEAKSKTITGDFFNQPATWRQAQFQAADAAWGYQPDDWVVFIDGHEGLSCDTRSLPDDTGVNVYSSWMHREITRAGANTHIAIPFFAYVHADTPVSLSYHPLTDDEFRHVLDVMGMESSSETDPEVIADYNTVTIQVATPNYVDAGGIVRMAKVSALRGAFNWASLDTLTAADANVKIQLISYGYAHWSSYDWDFDLDGVPPTDANNDKGWVLRNKLSAIRPIPGLPIGTWVSVASDPAGLDGPSYSIVGNEPVLGGGQGTAAALYTPMYQTIFRFNLRDGVWYEDGAKGNVPLVWNPDLGEWVPTEDQYEWYDVAYVDQGTGQD